MTFETLSQKAQAKWQAFERVDRPRVLIGAATCGRSAGALAVREAFEACQGVDIHEVGCLGLCYAEPLVDIALPSGPRVLFHNVRADHVPILMEQFVSQGIPPADLALASLGGTSIPDLPALTDLPMMQPQVRVVLRNAGLIDPTNLDHYIARDGYAGLAKALGQEPETVCARVEASGLRGRGGAGFLTGKKWQFARQAPGEEKVVICNADEGDPGAFMDRAVLESDPHTVLEGLIIAAYAIGAQQAIIYVRAEYPLAIERLETAIAQARGAGLLGADILGSGFALTIEIKRGAGAFVCGEETALIASIEGQRGTPRPRPPYPAVRGLHGKPTNVNNVETLSNLPEIVRRGAHWFSRFGTENSRGTKTFALAGTIERTGLIEVPMGITLREIIMGAGGGILNGRSFKAVQTGGPSGGCLPASKLDLPIDYQELAAAGSIMGSGGMIVMDEDACMVDIARYFIEFTHNESCGQCTPCRIGSDHLLRILTDMTTGQAGPEHLTQLKALCHTIQQGSLCGMGQTLPNPVLTALQYFPDEFEKHIVDQQCPAGVCRALFHYTIHADTCTGCGRCKKVCAFEAITGEKKTVHIIEPERCTKCGTCYAVCPFDAVRRV